MGQSAIGYPVVAKPDRGSRSFGAYRVEGEAGLKYLLERISNDYLVEEYCEGPIEAGLFFVRSPGAGRPPLYGVAIKRDAYVPGMAPHPELIPLRTRFLCADETARLTPALQHLIDAFASATPFDMGRLDVRARSLELLLSEPHSMRVLEVNVGFTAADFHVTDLRHPLSMRLKMTIVKWECRSTRRPVLCGSAATDGSVRRSCKVSPTGVRPPLDAQGYVPVDVEMTDSAFIPTGGGTKSTAQARVG